MATSIWRLGQTSKSFLTGKANGCPLLLYGYRLNGNINCKKSTQRHSSSLTMQSSQLYLHRHQKRQYSDKTKEREFKEHQEKRERTLHMNRLVDIVGFVYMAFGAMYLLFYFGRKLYLRLKGFKKIKVTGMQVKFYDYKGVTVPEGLTKTIDDILSFKVRSDDVWIVSFPRSGATWLQEVVYLLKSDLNYAEAKGQLLDDRFPHLEWLYPGTKKIEAKHSPRLIKSNLPLSVLPHEIREVKPKIIYLARNPRDVVVSNFYYSKQIYPITKFDGNFEDFFDMFLDNNVLYGPWSNHVKDFWDLRFEDNVLFLTYEDMQKDASGTIERVAEFLGKKISDCDKEELIEHSSFEEMKENIMVNHSWYKQLGVATGEPFFRKGCVGDWKNHFEKGMQTQLDLWVKDTLSAPELTFCYDTVDDDTV